MHVLEGESMQLLIFNHMFSSIVFVRIQNAFFHTYTKRKEKKEHGEGKEERIQNLPFDRLLPFGSCSSAATELLFLESKLSRPEIE